MPRQPAMTARIPASSAARCREEAGPAGLAVVIVVLLSGVLCVGFTVPVFNDGDGQCVPAFRGPRPLAVGRPAQV